MRLLPLAVVAALAVAGCSASASSSSPAAPAAAVTSHKAAKPKPCKLKTKFDYIVRDAIPGTPATATEIGNVNLASCTSSLKDFRATAGTADGECTTIALASDNPGYNADKIPAPKLKKVIESAGSGC